MSSTVKPSFEVSSARKARVPPSAPWSRAIPSDPAAPPPRFHLPQAIAHRGFKAAWPENSLAGFREAVAVGAHALETDLRLSADGVVVLSHDLSLKRCFGLDRDVTDCEWEMLSELRTVRQPAQPMARLDELLEWLIESPERDAIWLMLDIKISSDADALMTALKRTLDKIPSSISWDQRIVLGCWNATYIQSATSILPSFPLCHISMSTSYSRHFSRIPNLSFSLARFSLLGPWGARFLRDAKEKMGVPTFTWTVNEERWMEWFVRMNIPASPDDKEPARPLLDGVITDDPRLFLDVCARITAGMRGRPIPCIAYSHSTAKSAHTTYTHDSNENSNIKDWILNSFSRAFSSLYQLLLGSYFRTNLLLDMRYYRGHFDYFSDADFLAHFPAGDDVEED